MTRKNIFTLLAGILFFTGGCLFPRYHQVRDFDLDVEPVPGAGNVYVSVMRNLSGSGIRLQRRSGFELTRDPYNVWVLEPGALVSCALNRALCRDGATPTITVRGEIERFEADLPNRVFCISGFYKQSPGEKKIRFDISAPLRSSSTDNIVLAASEAVRQLALRMAATGK